MVFCNTSQWGSLALTRKHHNPYFNRWFSAIILSDFNCEKENDHNPYFNRWFSAIQNYIVHIKTISHHNPYFNRWFSAIYENIPNLHKED